MPGDRYGPQFGPPPQPATGRWPHSIPAAEIAAIRRRFGYRRLHILLQRERLLLNHKNLRQLYAEERLQVRGGRKPAFGCSASAERNGKLTD